MNNTLKTLISVRQPGWTLDRCFYVDQKIFEADLRQVFQRGWLFVGHISQVRTPGDYFTYSVGNDSIIIIRGRDLEVHALFNVCRHRGSLICAQAAGNSKALVCPYHQWVYDTDGSLLNARLMPETFDKSQFGLKRAEVRVLQGLIFVSLNDAPPDFEPFANALQPRLKPHGLEQAKICHARHYEVEANWKLVVENSRECYHCGAGHPQYCRAIGFAAAIDLKHITEENESIAAEQEAQLRLLGIETSTIPFLPDSWFHCRRFFFRNGFETESLDGRPVAPLMGTIPHRQSGVLAVVTLPNFLLEANGDYAMTMRFTPAGPSRTNVDVSWLVHEDASEGKNYDVERVTAFWRMTSEQDWKLCEDNQAGVNSSRYSPGPYSPDEAGVEHFVQWYSKQLDGE